MFSYPIAVMSFNRPDLLAEVLLSLKGQSLATGPKSVYLFQDGPRDGDSRAQLACAAIFREHFPDGQCFESSTNLGVGLNFERAEKYFFETLRAECAVFLEDDLVLGPDYLQVLAQLVEFSLNEPKVAYVASYGRHLASLEEQNSRASDVVPMDHKWGFALTRRQYLRQLGIVSEYLDLIRDKDYLARDARAINEYFAKLGFHSTGTSQDAAKDIASLVLGTCKIMNFVCLGQYIGKEGVHFRAKLFAEAGYDKTIMYRGPSPKLVMPTGDQLLAWVQQTRNAAALSTKTVISPPARTATEPVQSPSLKSFVPAPATQTLPKAPQPPAETAPALPNIPSKNPIPSAPTQDGQFRPRMTAAELELLTRHVASAKRYLEFGSGGSTLLALEASAATIISVESDTAWIEKLKTTPGVSQAVRGGRLTFHSVDLGPVGAWGNPTSDQKIRNWPKYYLAPWTLRDYAHDFVLIDGRFRVMCALAAAKFITQEAKVAIHDYSLRRHYFVIEKYYDVLEQADTLVVMQRRPRINDTAWLVDLGEYMFDFN